MAGNFMDAPANRQAYDRDGSLTVATASDGTITSLTSTQMRTLNAESGTGVQMPSLASTLGVVFPIPMDLSALFIAANSAFVATIQTSQDTTNGYDGTWVTQMTYSVQTTVSPNYRRLSMLAQLPVTSTTHNVRGVRIFSGGSGSPNLQGLAFRALHVYANPSASATKDRLEFWRPDESAPVPPAFFDWGDVPRGTTADKTFKIKNLSSTLTATDVTLFIESLTAAAPPLEGMFLLSDNGGSSFLPGLNLGDLPPGGFSALLTVRRNVPTNASVSVWSIRLIADVTEWEV